MNADMLKRLAQITPEEQALLDGKGLDRSIYTTQRSFIADRRTMLARDQLLGMRTHTRFTEFPDHTHNFVEIMYMCSGQTTHIINGSTTVLLERGDLLFLNQHVSHRILYSGAEDVGVNFIVLPEFFDQAFSLLAEENILRRFIADTLQQDGSGVQVLHFHVSDVPPVQNLLENLIGDCLRGGDGSSRIQQVTMALLFLYLPEYIDRIEQADGQSPGSFVAMNALKYIEEHYKDATLTTLSESTGQPLYQLSRIIKAETGSTFKQLLQQKRFRRAVELLTGTAMPVSAVIDAVGYDNTSYFYRKFTELYGISPKEYRRQFPEASSEAAEGTICK